MGDNNDRSTVFVTRRRYDCIFVLTILFTWPVFIGIAIYFNEWRMLAKAMIASPLACVPLWLIIRFTTPKKGIRQRTISGSPGVPQFLMVIAVVFAMMGALMMYDARMLGHRLSDPIELRHWLFLGLAMAAIFGSAYRCDRIHNRSKDLESA